MCIAFICTTQLSQLFIHFIDQAVSGGNSGRVGFEFPAGYLTGSLLFSLAVICKFQDSSNRATILCHEV
jgi:hypothetical protein